MNGLFIGIAMIAGIIGIIDSYITLTIASNGSDIIKSIVILGFSIGILILGFKTITNGKS